GGMGNPRRRPTGGQRSIGGDGSPHHRGPGRGPRRGPRRGGAEPIDRRRLIARRSERYEPNESSRPPLPPMPGAKAADGWSLQLDPGASSPSRAAWPPAAAVSTDTTRSAAKRNRVSGPPAFGPVPDSPRPPNGCTSTTAPIWLRLT